MTQSLMWVFEHDFHRAEFDWLACDRAGRIGVFSTAGQGPLPDVVVARASDLETLTDDLFALPLITEAEVTDAHEGNPAFFYDLARRGLFAWDWSAQRGRYVLQARPTNGGELVPDSLPTGYLEAARSVVLELDFRIATSLKVGRRHSD